MKTKTKNPGRQNDRHLIRLNNLRAQVRAVLRRRDLSNATRLMLEDGLESARLDSRLERR